MKLLAVTQRVDILPSGERRDALDQRWYNLLAATGFTPFLIPNVPKWTPELLNSYRFSGILLTGGNDLAVYGGDAPERDETEQILLNFAIQKKIPVLGVCRGMQVIQSHFQVKLKKTPNQVMEKQKISINGIDSTVNSYHCWGTTETNPSLKTWAVGQDGVIKAVSHESLPLHGIMWHPERYKNVEENDIQLFKKIFGA